MKQLMFCYKDDGLLSIRYTITTDVFVPVEDIVSPQKTTLIIPKTSKIEQSDIVIIRDNDTGIVEYIGYIDTIATKIKTEISCYPLINVFDNDYVLDQMFEKTTNENGEEVEREIDAIEWLSAQIKRAFIDTDDVFQSLPLIIRNKAGKPVFYKKIIDTANLFEVYLDLFISKGVYIVFSGLTFVNEAINGIYCDIYCNTSENPYVLRHDNPSVQNVDIIDNTFTNYNKIIATEEISKEKLEKNPDLQPKRYYFYLLNDNSITINPNDSKRIKQVRSKELTFVLKEDISDEENAKELLLAIHNELQSPEYNLQIIIDMFKNDKIKLYKRVDFYAENGIMYSTNITKVEDLNDLQVRITLGALRNSLTDFKKKVEAI